MFQIFDVERQTDHVVGRVAELRKVMQNRNVEGVIVPRGDEHLGEYVPAAAERLAWLTAFTGSAGRAVLLADAGALFVDGRYTTQAAAQTDQTVFEVVLSPPGSPEDWLLAHLKQGQTLGFDPRVHAAGEIRRLEKRLGPAGIRLVPLDQNPVDLCWTDRPPLPAAPVTLQPEALAGRSVADKIGTLCRALSDAHQDATVMTATDAVAWLLNIRGGDLSHTPVPLASAIARADGRVLLFLANAADRLCASVRDAFGSIVEIVPPEAMVDALDALGAAKARVRIAPEATPAWHVRRLEAAGAVVIEGSDLVAEARMIKTAAEIAGARAAHARDAVAMARFLAWLEASAPQGTLDEIQAAEKLEGLRRDTGWLEDISFDTISAAGPNAALPHYRVTRETNRPIRPGEIYLTDSGGQYRDGTTDVTRTVYIDTPDNEAPPAEMRRHFTLVLKGMIAISQIRFPAGTRGCDLDPLARQALWRAGCDYGHGTGHGVGSFLSVHEGPPGISRRVTTAFQPGMIVSNEPGYYRVGEYGIRIETLVVVTEPSDVPGGDQPMLGFETLTLVPIDRRLIDADLLDADERAWLDAYHARVREAVGPQLDGRDADWLNAATAPL